MLQLSISEWRDEGHIKCSWHQHLVSSIFKQRGSVQEVILKIILKHALYWLFGENILHLKTESDIGRGSLGDTEEMYTIIYMTERIHLTVSLLWEQRQTGGEFISRGDRQSTTAGIHTG